MSVRTERWKCNIMSPIDNNAVLWECKAPTTKGIIDRYNEDIGNGFLTLPKLNRCALGKSKSGMIRLYKIGDFSTRCVEDVI